MKKSRFVLALLATSTLLTACGGGAVKPYYAPFDEVMKWFDHGTFGESYFYNYYFLLYYYLIILLLILIIRSYHWKEFLIF